MRKIPKKTIIKVIAYAGGACAIAFCCYKLYKIVKEVKANEELTLIINQELAERRAAGRIVEEIEVGKASRPDIDEWEDEIDDDEDAISFEDWDNETQEEYIARTSKYYYPDKEELSDLRFDPNSIEAWNQYVDMRLADIRDITDTKDLMRRLFTHEFRPENDGDRLLFHHIHGKRSEFFGRNSKWNDGGTWAEVILHFAELTDFDIDGGVEYWVIRFLENLELSVLDKESRIDEVLEDLELHEFETSKGHGLFALDYEGWQEVFKRDTYDKLPMTILRQYNVFISIKLEDPEDEDYYGDDDEFY